MNWFGLALGAVTFGIIGLGFVWVIRGERYLGYLWWPYILLAGTVTIIVSLFIESNWGSAVVAAFGASFVWGATEMKEQAVRAEVGWFPFNDKKIRPPFEEIIKKWPAPHL